MALPVFPALPGLAYPAKRAAKWSTVKQDALSGKRTRYPLWTYPIYEYDIPFNFLRSDTLQEWQALEGFVNSVQGAAQLWAYNDVNDNTVSGQLNGEGDGVTLSFQLVRSLGGFTEPVFIINGTPSLTVGGTPATPASISAYGVVTFSSPPPSGAQITWSGSYYWPCRFDDDTTSFEQMFQYIFNCKSLKFSTEKLP